MKDKWKKEILCYALIALGSILYSVGTVCFIFPNGLLLGGTSGISVILNAFLPFSPGTILVIINILLIVVAFFALGRDMAIKTFVGSALTTAFIGLTEKIIVKKYAKMDIGKALLVTDLFIVIVGGILSGWGIALSSFLGLLIKTLGIDLVIFLIVKFLKKQPETEEVEENAV